MIIGNNNNNNFIKNNYTNLNQRFQAANNNENNNIAQPLSSMPYKDINSPKEMADRSFELLQQRYNNGLISLDEFTKKCEQLNKQRQNY